MHIESPCDSNVVTFTIKIGKGLAAVVINEIHNVTT